MSCIKYLLFLFNLLFAISGIVILTVGIMVQNMFSNYSFLMEEKMFSLSLIFIIIGIFIFIVAFFGCCGAIKESNYMLMTFAGLLCLIFVMEAVGGIAGYMKKDDLNQMLEMKMNHSLSLSKTNIYHKKTWNALQFDFSCCGVNSFTDWFKQRNANGSLPPTCCPLLPMGEDCAEGNSRAKVSKRGCLPALASTLEHNVFGIIIFGLLVGFIQFIGVIFACCMSRSIRKYETV